MVRNKDTASAWEFFGAVRRSQLVSHYQFNLMLSLCTTRAAVMELVGLMEEAGVAWDPVTYTALHSALVRCGEHREATAVLRRGRDSGLVDEDAASIAATSALKHIIGDTDVPFGERSAVAQA